MRHKFIFLSSLFAISSVLPLTLVLKNQREVKAQPTLRPYVVLVNGYQDCCAFKMKTVKSELEQMGAEIITVPWDSFQHDAKQQSNTSNDDLFIFEGKRTINRLDPDRPIVMIGHSYGGDSLIKLASQVTERKILFLGVIDPVAGGGLRAPVTNYTITSNVRYFFNRWQQNGLVSSNVVPFDSRIDGRIDKCNAMECDQEEQSLRRNADSSSNEVSCGAHEVSCKGWRLPGCNFGGCWEGSNGTKQQRTFHNDMPQDEYIQRQIIDKVRELLTTQELNIQSNGSSPWGSDLTKSAADPLIEDAKARGDADAEFTFYMRVPENRKWWCKENTGKNIDLSTGEGC